MTNVTFDIETLPDLREGAKERFIEKSVANFKAPSTLTKTQAATDLGLTDEKEIKFTSAGDMKLRWEREMAPKMAEEVGIENWKKTSFDGGAGQIFSFAFKAHEQVYCFGGLDEKEVLLSLNSMLGECLSRSDGDIMQPYFIGHYISGFDLRFLYRRYVCNGIRPTFKIPHLGRHGKDYFDNQIAWCGFKDRISQDNLCKALGIEGKPDDIDGSRVWAEVEAGNHQKVIDYNVDDILKAEMVYNKLNYIS